MVKARTLWPGVESPPAPTGQGAEHPVYPCQSNCISSPDCHLLNDPSNNDICEKTSAFSTFFKLIHYQFFDTGREVPHLSSNGIPELACDSPKCLYAGKMSRHDCTADMADPVFQVARIQLRENILRLFDPV